MDDAGNGELRAGESPSPGQTASQKVAGILTRILPACGSERVLYPLWAAGLLSGEELGSASGSSVRWESEFEAVNCSVCNRPARCNGLAPGGGAVIVTRR